MKKFILMGISSILVFAIPFFSVTAEIVGSYETMPTDYYTVNTVTEGAITTNTVTIDLSNAYTRIYSDFDDGTSQETLEEIIIGTFGDVSFSDYIDGISYSCLFFGKSYFRDSSYILPLNDGLTSVSFTINLDYQANFTDSYGEVYPVDTTMNLRTYDSDGRLLDNFIYNYSSESDEFVTISLSENVGVSDGSAYLSITLNGYAGFGDYDSSTSGYFKYEYHTLQFVYSTSPTSSNDDLLFNDPELDAAADEFDAIIQGSINQGNNIQSDLDLLNRPDAGDLANSIDPFNFIENNGYLTFTGFIGNIINWAPVVTLLSIGLTVAFVSYVLFGKKR